jgi:hypothetical protein
MRHLPDIKVGQVWQGPIQRHRIHILQVLPSDDHGRVRINARLVRQGSERVDLVSRSYSLTIDTQAEDDKPFATYGAANEWGLSQLLYDPPC